MRVQEDGIKQKPDESVGVRWQTVLQSGNALGRSPQQMSGSRHAVSRSDDAWSRGWTREEEETRRVVKARNARERTIRSTRCVREGDVRPLDDGDY